MIDRRQVWTIEEHFATIGENWILVGVYCIFVEGDQRLETRIRLDDLAVSPDLASIEFTVPSTHIKLEKGHAVLIDGSEFELLGMPVYSSSRQDIGAASLTTLSLEATVDRYSVAIDAQKNRRTTTIEVRDI